MKRTILITGGAGFIGSHVVRLFVNKYPDYRIVNLDKLTYAGNLANLRDVEERPNYTFVRGDICDFEAMRELFQQYGVDGVIHLAAESHVDRSIRDPFTFARTNVMGTLSLLEAAREYWNGEWDGKLFYHISTDEVYGDLPLDRPDLFFTEETPIHTSSPYSSSKASADLLVHVADASHPDLLQQITSVETILEELELQHMPRILLLNKWDLLDVPARAELADAFPHAIPVSARTGDGLNRLLEVLENMLLSTQQSQLLIPFEEDGPVLQ